MSAVLKPPAPAALSSVQAAAREKIWSMPLEDLHPADPQHFVDNVEGHIFDRLRAQDPVHYGRSPVPEVGNYWSVTRYQDIMFVDTHPELFSSDWSKGGITLFNVRKYALTGVDYVSAGALTHSAQPLDMSLKIVK